MYIFQNIFQEDISMSVRRKRNNSIGKNLRKLRKNAKLSQEDVAAKLELMGLSMSREIISQIELGRYNIRVSVLLAMKQIYNVATFDEFFRDL